MLKQPPKKRLKTIVRAYGLPILLGIIFACVLVYFCASFSDRGGKYGANA